MPSHGFSRRQLTGRTRVFRTYRPSTSTTLAFGGRYVLHSTAASKRYNISAPGAPGDEVEVFCDRATTALLVSVYLPTGWSFQRTSNSTATNHRRMVFNAGHQSARLIALSTSRIGYSQTNGAATNTT